MIIYSKSILTGDRNRIVTICFEIKKWKYSGSATMMTTMILLLSPERKRAYLEINHVRWRGQLRVINETLYREPVENGRRSNEKRDKIRPNVFHSGLKSTTLATSHLFVCDFETFQVKRTDCNFRLFSMTFRVRVNLLPEITVFLA